MRWARKGRGVQSFGIEGGLVFLIGGCITQALISISILFPSQVGEIVSFSGLTHYDYTFSCL